MTRTDAVALVCGVTFALGLGISGMTQPSKVIGFLNVAGAWDPSLAFVMAGAIGVHSIFARPRAFQERPRLALSFSPPARTRIDRRLLLGAALFGLGWGIGGFCPGPALVSVVTFKPTSLAFVASMLAGMGIYALTFEPAKTDAERRAPSISKRRRLLGRPPA